MPQDSASWIKRSTKRGNYSGERSGLVLVAEDHQINQQILAHFLTNFGVEFEIVPNGALAVEAVKSGRFSIVLMDIQMPVMDGVAATRAIRALDGAQRDIPIVAVTAFSGPEQNQLMLAAGMNGVIAKPVVAATLQHALETHLASSNSGTAN